MRTDLVVVDSRVSVDPAWIDDIADQVEVLVLRPDQDGLDQVLLMSVNPGFGGQSFLDLVLPKIQRTRELVQRTGQEIWIQVDGGVSVDTIGRAAEAGADVFVAGTAVYRAGDPDAMVNQLRDLAITACAH